MRLRKYQTEARDALLASWAAGKRNPCLVSPTGSGKTEMALATMEGKLAELGGGAQGLVLTHTKVLYQQAIRRFRGMTVQTIQSLLAPGRAGDKRRATLARYRVVCIDEVHHLAAQSWRAVLPLLAGKYVFGPTATPVRADGTPLGDVCDDMIVAANYAELLRDGYLSRCDVHRSELSRSAQKAMKVRPDGVAAYLEHGRVEPSDPRYAAGLRWRPGIYFDGTVAQCQAAVERFCAAGVHAALITFRTTDRERQRLFDAYTRGELDMLAAPMALSEGFDSPRAEVCVLRRMANGVGTYLQIVGRVLRPYPGKRRALLIDCSGASEHGVHGLPTSNRIYTLDGKGVTRVDEPDAVEEPEEDEESVPVPVPVRPYEDVQVQYQLVRDTLLARYEDLQREAERDGCRSGWVWHQMQQATGIVPPRVISAPSPANCRGCGDGIPRGAELFFVSSGQNYHSRCWFRSLEAPELAPAMERQIELPALKPIIAQRDDSYDWVDELR